MINDKIIHGRLSVILGFTIIGLLLFVNISYSQIIADHTVVDQFDQIPNNWIDSVKTKSFVICGASHSYANIQGLALLKSQNSAYNIYYDGSYRPPQYVSDNYLRLGHHTWGDVDNETGWISSYDAEDWFGSELAISRTKAGITYCNNDNRTMRAFGYGWCYDEQIDTEEEFQQYIDATQEYNDYCANSINTVVFFTTGTVDYYAGEIGYRKHLGYEQIRSYVRTYGGVLFDYADILCYDSNSTEPNTTMWDGHTYPIITNTNVTPIETGHISNAGAIRLAKAVWWMMARIAGWDGNTGGPDNTAPSTPGGLSLNSFSETSVLFSWAASADNVGVTGYNIYRNGSFMESVTGLSYTDNSLIACTDYSYTVSAFDAAGNESSQSEPLFVNTCSPDITPTITLSPNVANGITIFDIIVKVTELNSANTNGDIVVHIPKDQHWDFSESYNTSLTVLGETYLNNNDWSYSEDATNHIFTSSTTILAGSFSTFGFKISFDPGSSTGMNPITTQLVSGGGGEVEVSNNSDSEQLDYFQQ